MATPQPKLGSKRVLDEADESLPTRKAPRWDDEATGVGAVLANLQKGIDTLRAIDPGSLDEEQYALAVKASSDLCTTVDLMYDQRMAAANPPPEEVPVPFDHLVQILSHLEPEELATAAQVSRHFNRAVPEAVRCCLNEIARCDEGSEDGCFEMRFKDKYTPEFLRRVLDDYGRLPHLVRKIKKKQSHDAFYRVGEELEGIHEEVIYLHNELLWDRLERLQGSEHVDKRRLLLRLLDMANIPEDELGDYDRADALARELEPMMEPPGGATGEALSLMARLPLAAINAHQDVLLRWLNHDHDGSCGQYKALVALKRLPPATLAQQPSVKEDTERLYRSKGRGYFEIEIRELAKQIRRGLP